MNDNLHQYAELIHNMRKAQKRNDNARVNSYPVALQKAYLIRSKYLEEQVDAWTDNIVNGVNLGSGQ